jgi:O-acetyl-ADP-ribose deacetylase (regulator of RNase III)
MHVTIGNTLLELTEGDIALQDTEAVVTAAHWDLEGGQGTDGSIHGKGGPEILAECRKIGACPIGGAVITGAGRLKARYVIHAVGPVYETGDEYEQDLLACAYRNSLLVAVENNIRTISFPSISTGAFVYPLPLAAPIAMQTIVDFLRTEEHQLELVRMVLYPDEQKDAYGIYAAALRQVLAE